MRPLSPWRAFGLGWLTGVAMAGTALVAASAWAMERGVTARIDAAAVARDMRPAIEAQVAAVIPGIIEDMKRETPPRVAAELSRLLDHSEISIYGVSIRLPEHSMREVRRQIEAVVAQELTRSLEAIDVAESARYWGAQGEQLLLQALRRTLHGRTFTLELGTPEPWLAVPVTLQLERR